MISFNGLTPAEAERLALLAEECGEVIQAIGKVLRHGYENSYDNGETNRAALEREIGDVEAAIDMLIDALDVNTSTIEAAILRKKRAVSKYLHHQENQQ